MGGSSSVPAEGLDDGETIRSAAAREAYEEVGVQIAATDLHHVHTLHSRTNGQSWIGHFFKTEQWAGTPALRELDMIMPPCTTATGAAGVRAERPQFGR